MSAAAIDPQWPACEECGAAVWKVHREPHASGFEKQSFTCSNCGHLTERTVAMSEQDAAQTATAGAEAEAG